MKRPPHAQEKPLRGEKHRLRHEELHAALDELIADWAIHNSWPCNHCGRLKVFSNTTIEELMKWSHKQTIEPDEERSR